MTTVADVIDDVSSELHSYTGVQEMTTWLSADLADTDLQFSVADPNVTRGRVEIGNELIEAASVEGNNTVTVPPWGRGRDGSTPQTWPSGTRVTNDPIYPRARVFRTLCDIALRSSPELFKVEEVSVDWTVYGNYVLPTNTDHILAVYSKAVPNGPALPVRRWQLKPQPNPELWTTGGTPTFPIVVQCALPLGIPASEDDDIDTLGWTPFRACLAAGAEWRLVQGMEAGRLANQSVIPEASDDKIPVGSATNLAKTLYAVYMDELQTARKALLGRYPSTIHWKVA